MTFLPIAERELRVAARRPMTYRIRFWLALTGFLMWLALLIGSGHAVVSERSKVLFIIVGVLGLGFSLLAGMFLTADCLSEEKREGTLGLLFLTSLKGHDVVLGKLLATSLHAFFGLLAILPLLALPLLMGGVTVGEFWRVALALLTAIFFSLAVGMFVSSLTSDARQAIATTFLSLLVLVGVMPAIWWVAQAAGGITAPAFLRWGSPVHLYVTSFDTFYNARTGDSEFLGTWLTLILLSVGGLAFSSFYVPRAWQQPPEQALGSSPRGTLNRRLRFGSREFRQRRRWLLEANPVRWLASRDRLPRSGTCLSVGALSLICVGFLFGCFSRSRTVRAVCFGGVLFLAFAIHQLLKMHVIVESTRRLSEDKRSGALELLLVSPLSVGQITDGIRSGLIAMFAPAVALVLLLNAGLFFVVAGPNPLEHNSEEAMLFCEVSLLGGILLVFDFFALTWMGMAMALKKQKHLSAIVAAFVRVMLFPWLGMLFLWLFGPMLGASWTSGDLFGVIFSWFCGCGLVDLLAAGRARMILLEELRNRSYEQAADRGMEHELSLAGAYEGKGRTRF